MRDEDIEGGEGGGGEGLRKFIDTRKEGSENLYTSKPTGGNNSEQSFCHGLSYVSKHLVELKLRLETSS